MKNAWRYLAAVAMGALAVVAAIFGIQRWRRDAAVSGAALELADHNAERERDVAETERAEAINSGQARTDAETAKARAEVDREVATGSLGDRIRRYNREAGERADAED